MNRNTNTVKNRAPAPIQISAEQLLREASERQADQHVLPVNKIADAEEYQSQMRIKRKTFEDDLRYRREHIGTWVKYANFEEENKEFERARSIYERALEVENGQQLWLRYAEFEMRNEFVNHARNVWDRAVAILPRVDQFWYKYSYMEEMIGDSMKCRAVFERWMEWLPDDNAWLSYARFEKRCGTLESARNVMERYIAAYPSTRSFLKYAKWAENDGRDIALARGVFERALEELEVEEVNAKVMNAFARFEERHGEHERARLIYKHAIKVFNLGGSGLREGEELGELEEGERKRRDELYKSYISFEKKHGNKEGVENVILTKQRGEYKAKTDQDNNDYDSWFEWARLEETHGEPSDVRKVYEHAISMKPPSREKKHWKRYIYLWINYALYEELEAGDIDRAAEIYKICLTVIPHKNFSFSKIWILAAKCHIRRRDLGAARSVLGRAIGMCGKEKIFEEYIALELALGEVDRCRKLYTKYLETYPENCNAWSKYADLESSVGETDRCRALFELAVNQESLDQPELLWKGFIDFEIAEGEADKARTLFGRLLDKTNHVKVWISFATFEVSDIGAGADAMRKLCDSAYKQLKEDGLKEERVLLLDAWRDLEKEHGTPAKVGDVEAMMPRRIKKKRMKTDENGTELGWEEFYDYHFPDEKSAASNLKILEMAAKWKAKQQAAAAGGGSNNV